MEAFPKAKVILTTRSPNTWYSSVKESIFISAELEETLAGGVFLKVTPKGRQLLTTQRICNFPTNGHPQGNDYRTI